MSKRNEKPATTQGPSLVMPTFPHEAFETWFKACSAWLDSGNRAQAEAIRFLSGRLERDVEMLTRFSGCREPEEFITAQAEFANGLISDYMQESSRLLALWSESMKGALNRTAEFADAGRRK